MLQNNNLFFYYGIFFFRDLSSGQEIEEKHLTLIKKTYPDAYRVTGYCKEWDIFIPSKNFGVEIKSDKMSQTTGNLVVEINFDGKPSALSTTKSKYWIFDTGLKHIIVRVSDLKELVKSHQTRKFIGRGDTRPKEAYLIKQNLIEDIAISNIE